MGKQRSKPKATKAIERNSATAITNETEIPKCLMSPINQSQTNIQPLPSFNTVLSPFTGPKPLYPCQIDADSNQNSPFVKIAPKQQPLNENLLSVLDQSLPKTTHFQSTPNKPEIKISNSRVNFHSIHDLATSSSSSINSSNSSGYSSFTSMIQSRVSKYQSHDNEDEVKVEKKKNQRTSFSRNQKYILECAYKAKHYPESNQIKDLCQLLGLKESVIRVCKFKYIILSIDNLYLLPVISYLRYGSKIRERVLRNSLESQIVYKCIIIKIYFIVIFNSFSFICIVY